MVTLPPQPWCKHTCIHMCAQTLLIVLRWMPHFTTLVPPRDACMHVGMVFNMRLWPRRWKNWHILRLQGGFSPWMERANSRTVKFQGGRVRSSLLLSSMPDGSGLSISLCDVWMDGRPDLGRWYFSLNFNRLWRGINCELLLRLTHQPSDSQTSDEEIYPSFTFAPGVKAPMPLGHLRALCVTLNITNAYMLRVSMEKKWKLFQAIEGEYCIRRTVSGVSVTSTQSSHHHATLLHFTGGYCGCLLT